MNVEWGSTVTSFDDPHGPAGNPDTYQYAERDRPSYDGNAHRNGNDRHATDRHASPHIDRKQHARRDPDGNGRDPPEQHADGYIDCHRGSDRHTNRNADQHADG